MISTIAIIGTVYVINPPVIKIRKNHHALIFFQQTSPRSFQNTQTIETCLSDFHKLVVTILKMYLPNNQQKSLTEAIKTLIIVILLRSCCLRLRNLDH